MHEDHPRTLSIRPGRDVSVSSVIALAGMFVFGIVFAAVVANVLYDNEAPWGLSVLVVIFMLAWLATTLSLLVYHVRNLRRGRGAALFDVEFAEGLPHRGEAPDESPANQGHGARHDDRTPSTRRHAPDQVRRHG